MSCNGVQTIKNGKKKTGLALAGLDFRPQGLQIVGLCWSRLSTTPTVDHLLFLPMFTSIKAAYTRTGYAIVTWLVEYVLYRALASKLKH